MPGDKTKFTAKSENFVQVKGLAEFRRELKVIDTRLPRTLGAAHQRAAELVAERARSAAASQGGVAAKTAPSIRAMKSAVAAKVVLGGPNYPFALGAEFGGRKRPTTQQFKPWRGNQHDEGMEPGSGVGYFLYPTIRATHAEFMEAYWNEVSDVFREAFPD